MEDDVISSFMEITACDSSSVARSYLDSCDWCLEAALNRFFTAGPAAPPPQAEQTVRAPIPARMDILCGVLSGRRGAHDARTVESVWEPSAPVPAMSWEQVPPPTGWDDDSSSYEEAPRPPAVQNRSLADLFRPPYELMYDGSFHDAKVHAAMAGRWLLVNVQSRNEFASHVQNRDLWGERTVKEVIEQNFVFWQVQREEGDYNNEGSKVCCYYKLADELPAVLVVDPITGQKMDKWCGTIEPKVFQDNSAKYIKSKPAIASKPTNTESIAAPTRNEQEPAPPAAPVPTTPAEPVVEEPVDGEMLCKMRVRFPDGQLIGKEFGSKRGVKALFAYCRSVIDDGGAAGRPFRLMTIAGCLRNEIPADTSASFEELQLNCCTISVILC